MYDIPVQSAINDPTFEALSAVVLEAMRRLGVPGVAFGILHDGRQFMAGFGVTSVENPLPVTADTLFQIGSTTKTFTGTIALMLVERGLLDLDAPVKQYLPAFELRDKTAEATVTSRDLLTHMGGWVGDFFEETGSGDDALTRYVADMAELEQVVPVRTLWAYNNAGFAVMGRIIEVITGRTYEAVLQEMLLDPLGMDHSFLFANDVLTRRFVVGHQTYPGQGVVVLRPWALARSAHAVGGISSSVRDQLRYAAFQLGDGTAPNGERLLRRATMDDMQRPHVQANLDRQMGLSWILREIDGVMAVMHGGATNGQESAFLMAPSRGFAITVLTNADEGTMLHEEIVDWALAHYLGLSMPKAEPIAEPANLEGYTGDYRASLSTLRLYVEGGRLMAQQIPHGGFPDKDSPPGPTPPPSRMAFYAPDKIVALDPPLIRMRAEFLRDGTGEIVWLRTSRLHRRAG